MKFHTSSDGECEDEDCPTLGPVVEWCSGYFCWPCVLDTLLTSDYARKNAYRLLRFCR